MTRAVHVLETLDKAKRPVTLDELARACGDDYHTETFGMLIWHLWMTGRLELSRDRARIRPRPKLSLVCARGCGVPLDPVIPAQGWTMHPSCEFPPPRGSRRPQ